MSESTYILEIDRYLTPSELSIWNGTSILSHSLQEYYKKLWKDDFYNRHVERRDYVRKHNLDIEYFGTSSVDTSSVDDIQTGTSNTPDVINKVSFVISTEPSITETEKEIKANEAKRKLKLIISCSNRVTADNIACGCSHYCTLKGLPAENTLCIPCVENKLSNMSTQDIVKIDSQKGYMVRSRKPITWAYGVTTVPGRRQDTLPRTLHSLKLAGFYNPRLFVDGCTPLEADSYEKEFKLPVTARDKTIRTFGNWHLALHELFIREPLSNRYAIFQDDMITYKNLRGYLDALPYPEKGYINLFTFPVNQELNKKENNDKFGLFKSNQMGKGAVGLVFDRDAVLALLSSFHMAERPTDQIRGHRAVDGAIVTALKHVGISEYCHNPSLVYHIGDVSSMGNPKHPNTLSFKGEEFDATNFIENLK